MKHCLLAFVLAFALAGCGLHRGVEASAPRQPPSSGFRVMTYNIAHGTRVPIPPFLVGKRAVCSTLVEIGSVMKRENPDVVALQETDGGGPIDRPLALGRLGGFASVERGMRHGSVLLARAPLDGVDSHAFAIGPLDDHGYVIGTLPSALTRGRPVTVVSVHLNPFSARARRRQIDVLASALDHRSGPLVIMGDLNCSSREPDDCVGLLERRLGVRAVARPPKTHAFLGFERTLDWVLVSDELDFRGYRALGDRLSDHRAVVADLVWR